MKLSFSTVGCPQWNWRDITACALDLGYNGIELRGLGDDLTLTQSTVFSPEKVRATADELKRQKLEIPCISTNCLLHTPEFSPDDANKYIDLAKQLNCPSIRVLCDSWQAPGENVDEALAEKNLLAILPYAENQNVNILVETNGVWADTKKLSAMLERINSPALGVVWDINHPVVFFGETPDETWQNIGKYVRHVHLKDSIFTNGNLVYKLLGYGNLPIAQVLKILKNNNYQGYVSMEWVKRWDVELEEPGVVFSHFVYGVRKLAE